MQQVEEDDERAVEVRLSPRIINKRVKFVTRFNESIERKEASLKKRGLQHNYTTIDLREAASPEEREEGLQ